MEFIQLTQLQFMEMNFLSIIETIFISMFKILFSNEFGIFWFSPILFASLISLVYFTFISNKHGFYNYLIILLVYGIPFSTVVLWQSTASSYGFRYLYSLIPIAILIYKKWVLDIEYKIFTKYLIYFSIFASLSIIFFETSPQTSLSQNINTFGIDDRFSQPNYLTGYLKSFLNIEAYLKIFTTSFLGVISFKIAFTIFSFDSINNFLRKINLPVDNEDYIAFVDNIEVVSGQQIAIFLLVIVLIVKWFVLLINTENKIDK